MSQEPPTDESFSLIANDEEMAQCCCRRRCVVFIRSETVDGRRRWDANGGATTEKPSTSGATLITAAIATQANASILPPILIRLVCISKRRTVSIKERSMYVR